MMLWLRDLVDRYDLLSLRERVLVLGALLGLILLIWDGLLMGPLEGEGKGRLQQLELLRAEVGGLEQSLEAVIAQRSADPDRETREAIQKLKAESAELDARLAGATSGLIAPQQMARVLEELLARTSRLKLRALRTLPPQSVTAPAAQGSAADEAQIYKHGLELELAGTYLDTLRFLQGLESLQYRFFWDRLEYSVERFPRGRVKLTLYTLGLEEGWIGV